MKRLIFSVLVTVAMLLNVSKTVGQTLPMVYSMDYNDVKQINQVASISATGDVVSIGKKENGKQFLLWLDRLGAAKLSMEFDSDVFNNINKFLILDNKKVILVGDHVSRKEGAPAGKVIVLDVEGNQEKSLIVGNNFTTVKDVKVLKDGDYILFTQDLSIDGAITSSTMYRYTKDGAKLFEHTPKNEDTLVWLGENDDYEYIVAAFNSSVGKGASVVKLDRRGKEVFRTVLSDTSFHIEDVSLRNGFTYLVGQGNQIGGAIVRIRPEGNIVYEKSLVQPTADLVFDVLKINSVGNVFVGGTDGSHSTMYMLREDGTALNKFFVKGAVSSVALDKTKGDVAVVLFDALTQRGSVIKINSVGKQLFNQPLAVDYSDVDINPYGDIVLCSPKNNRVSMMSSFGDLLFDRFIGDGDVQLDYVDAYMDQNSEIILTNGENNITKLGHALFISDVSIEKPVDGYATARFTVTLSGYSFSPEGAPQAVSVDYTTKEVTATKADHFDEVSGTLSFIPNTTEAGRYMSRHIIEVPVKANNYVEGAKTFAVELNGVKNSYSVRAAGVGTIEDQQAVVKLIGATSGLEGTKNAEITLGLFKTNGAELINRSNSNIVLTGAYSGGTADELDYDVNIIPTLYIKNGSHDGVFAVNVLEDARYELVKSIFVEFNKIHTMSDTKVSFQSSVLIAEGQIFDQPAYVSISSLGNQSQLSNSVSGFAKVSLHRTKDGVVQTNNSGVDVVVAVSIADSSSAILGKNFVLINNHNLKIPGDGLQSDINLNGIALFDPTATGDVTMSAVIDSVNQIPDAGVMTISSELNSCDVVIKKD